MLDPGTNMAHGVVFSHQNYYYGSFRGAAEKDESGTDTPPLWRATPPPSPPHRQEANYRCMSPASKAQAIARGQKELMEMVSRMPESCYELSLKDLVEKPLVLETKQERNEEDNFRREIKKKREERKIRPNRSGRYENHNGGLFLKTVIPVYVGVNRSSRKKNQHDSANSNSRISPKPPPLPLAAAESEAKGVDKEWWKKRSADQSSGSESIGSSTLSRSAKSTVSSSSSRNSRHQRGGGCWSFFRRLWGCWKST